MYSHPSLATRLLLVSICVGAAGCAISPSSNHYSFAEETVNYGADPAANTLVNSRAGAPLVLAAEDETLGFRLALFPYWNSGVDPKTSFLSGNTFDITELSGWAIGGTGVPNDGGYCWEFGLGNSEGEWDGQWVDSDTGNHVANATFKTSLFQFWLGYRLEGVHLLGGTHLSVGLVSLSATSEEEGYYNMELDSGSSFGAYVAAGYGIRLSNVEILLEFRQTMHGGIEFSDVVIPDKMETLGFGVRFHF